jgi:hypothetical protein
MVEMNPDQASRTLQAANTRAMDATKWLYGLMKGKKLVFYPGLGWFIPLENPADRPMVEILRNFGAVFQSEDHWYVGNAIVEQLKLNKKLYEQPARRKSVISAAPPNTERPSAPPPSTGGPASNRGGKPRKHNSVRPRDNRGKTGFYA